MRQNTPFYTTITQKSESLKSHRFSRGLTSLLSSWQAHHCKSLGGWARGPQVYKNIYPSLSSSDPAYAVRDRTYSFTCGV